MVDTFGYVLGLSNSNGSDIITDCTVGAAQVASDRIHICLGTGSAPTHSRADSGSDHIISVRWGYDTIAVITLPGITTGSANFADRNVVVSNNGPSCS